VRAIVTGMIATYPVGGVLWDYSQYALGLERLGFEVFYLEDTGWMAYDPRERCYVEDPSYGVAFLERSLGALSASLGRRWHVRGMDGRRFGLAREQFEEIVASADLLLNVSGGTLLRDEYLKCPRKVLIDTDPGWNHFRNYPRLDADPTWGGGHGYRAHDFFFTYAERIGEQDCALPTLGLDWHPTRPPVVLDLWQPRPPAQRWTTVMTWRNFAEVIEYRGTRYGTKEIEFEKVKGMPGLTPARLELATGGAQPPLEEWRALGWSVVDAHHVSHTPEAYRRYIECSRGEFSVAKNVYVDTRSGWFSCRSTCYLAARRPVVVQDTGFSAFIPCGEGVLAFSCQEEAADALRRVESDYLRHQAAARRIAEEYFASERVLGDLLARVGLR